MPGNNNWYEILEIGKLDSPALVVYPERVRSNIRTAISMTGDTGRLRPHVKTNKSPDAVRLMMDAGISKFKCATIAEAEMLGICGVKDAVLAYQPIGPKLGRFIDVTRKFPATQYGCLADNLAAAKEQSGAFSANGLVIPVYVDLNIGMNRSGIAPGNAAMELYSFLSTAPGIKAAGLHAYDGHLRDADIRAREIKCNEAFAAVLALKSRLERKGLKVSNVIAGGSPTFPIHARRNEVECSPGTFVYWDKCYMDNCPEQSFLPAAVLITRVISILSPTRICTDLGHKSVAAENEITKRVCFLNAGGLTPVSQSEEHLVLESAKDHAFRVGDVLYGLPYHICPTVALYEAVTTIQNGNISGEWKNIARDRKISC